MFEISSILSSTVTAVLPAMVSLISSVLGMGLLFAWIRRRVFGPNARETVPGAGRRASGWGRPEWLGAMPTRKTALLNQPERFVFDQLDAIVRDSGAGHRLFAQVSLGEVLKVDYTAAGRSAGQAAFNKINAKRLDFLIVDRAWHPVVAIEYHGKGHFRGNSGHRDAIKRTACQSAGLSLLEIAHHGLSAVQTADLRGRLRPAVPLAAE